MRALIVNELRGVNWLDEIGRNMLVFRKTMARGSYRRRGTEQSLRKQQRRLSDNLVRDIKGIRANASDFLVDRGAETSVAIDYIASCQSGIGPNKPIFRSRKRPVINFERNSVDTPNKESFS